MSVQSSSQDRSSARLRDRILAERLRRTVDAAGRRPPRDGLIRSLPLDRSRLPALGRGRGWNLGRRG